MLSESFTASVVRFLCRLAQPQPTCKVNVDLYSTLAWFTSNLLRYGLISISATLNRTTAYAAYTYTGLEHCVVPVYMPDFTGNYHVYRWRDSQAGLTWMTGYLSGRFAFLMTVTHPRTNQAWLHWSRSMHHFTKPSSIDWNTHNNTTVLRLCGICPGKPGWAGTRRNIHPLLSS